MPCSVISVERKYESNVYAVNEGGIQKCSASEKIILEGLRSLQKHKASIY